MLKCTRTLTVCSLSIRLFVPFVKCYVCWMWNIYFDVLLYLLNGYFICLWDIVKVPILLTKFAFTCIFTEKHLFVPFFILLCSINQSFEQILFMTFEAWFCLMCWEFYILIHIRLLRWIQIVFSHNINNINRYKRWILCNIPVY